MTEASTTHTHVAYAYQRTGRKHGRMLEVGSGYIDHDRNIANLVLTRLPIGGFSGFVQLAPHGVKPPPMQPQRPGEAGDGEEEAES